MNRAPKNGSVVPRLLLAAILLAAQAGVLVHANQHDTGAGQGQACVACAGANQLSAAASDHAWISPLPRSQPVPGSDRVLPVAVRDPLVVRLRGPPTPL